MQDVKNGQESKQECFHPGRMLRDLDFLHDEVARLKKDATKNARRDNLNRNLLNHFSREMWVYAITIAVVGGFALGVFLVNVRISSQLSAMTALEIKK